MAGCQLFDLPTEMLERVLSYLDGADIANLALTCSHFNNLCQRSSFYKRVTITNKVLTSNALDLILSKSTLTVLNLSNASVCNKEHKGRQSLVSPLSNLKKMHLGDTKICTKCTYWLLTSAIKLTHLNMDGHIMDDEKIAGLTIHTDLESISFSRSSAPSDLTHLLACFLHFLKFLKYVNLNALDHGPHLQCIVHFISPTIEIMDLSATEATDRDIQLLSSRCRKLKQLNISSCEMLTAASLRSIDQELELDSLAMWHNDQLDCSVFREHTTAKLKAIGISLGEGITDCEITYPDGTTLPLIDNQVTKYNDLYKKYLTFDFIST